MGETIKKSFTETFDDAKYHLEYAQHLLHGEIALSVAGTKEVRMSVNKTFNKLLLAEKLYKIERLLALDKR